MYFLAICSYVYNPLSIRLAFQCKLNNIVLFKSWKLFSILIIESCVLQYAEQDENA